MRIALAHPTYWPEVRRGSERMAHDLGATLAARGHEVTLLAGTRSRSSVTTEDGIEVVRRWRPPEGLPLTRAYEYHSTNVPNVIRGLAGGRFDVAHALFPTDALGAAAARALGGPPFVFSLNGIPTRPFLVRRRYRIEILTKVMDAASATAVLSEAAAEAVRRFLLHEPTVLPPGIMPERFTPGAPRSETPTLLCASSLGDPRKRGDLLMAAFERLRRERGDARLVVVRGRDDVMSGAEPRLPDGAEWIEADRTDDLAAAYASAWATVMPAVDEAFGLVLVESLASGTPVIAARSGGCPEIVSGERVGALFEPDDADALTGAMAAALERAPDPDTEAACRARAADYDWRILVERYEALYEKAIREGGT